MAARQVGPGGLSNFVPNGAGGHSRRDLAVILIGGAREAGLDDAKHVRAVQAGFYISDEMYALLEEADETEPQQDEPKPEPEAPKTKPRKRAAKKSSGNRAAKNTTKAEE
jgi:hypothetical protein